MANHILENNNQILNGLFHKLRNIRHLHSLLVAHLEPYLAEQCRVIKFEKNCLFVMTENGSWATRLRFQIPQLMAALRTHPELENLAGIICKIKPAFTNETLTAAKKRPVAKLSQKTSESILNAAKSITDEKLRRVLERIASHCEED
jgi:hypothetical protein